MALDGESRIPQATAKRLPLYYRYLERMQAAGRQRVSSAQISEALQLDPATVRRDLACLGGLGKKGYGYQVNFLLSFLRDFLRQDQVTHVVLIGVGNLGTALLQYNFQRSRNMRLVSAFDNDPAKIGTSIHDIPVLPLEALNSAVSERQVEVAILTVPAAAAQEIADMAVDAGVRGILNFAPVHIAAPDSVRVHNIDLTVELQTLIYFLKVGGE